MVSRRIGGGLLILVTVAVPTVLELSDIELVTPVVISAIAVFGVLTVLGLVLVLQPETPKQPLERTLPASFIAALTGRNAEDVSIQVRRYDQSSEAAAFERQLVASLQAAGWNADSFGHDGGTRQFKGTMLESGDVRSTTFRVLRRELKRAVDPIDVCELAQLPSNFIRVAIGAHNVS